VWNTITFPNPRHFGISSAGECQNVWKSGHEVIDNIRNLKGEEVCQSAVGESWKGKSDEQF
jgi:hypothetical protein